MASEAAETAIAAAADEGKAPGEVMKEQLKQSEAEARGEDAGGMERLIGGSPGRGDAKTPGGGPGGEDNGMCGLTERAVKAGGDCCVPKSARTNIAPEDKESNVEKVEVEELHNKGP